MKRLWFILPLLFIFSCEDKKDTVEKDTTPPSLTITSPSNGETISDKVVIRVTTEDDKEVSKVEFYIDDSLHVTDENSPYEYEWDTFPYKNGEHSIKIISYDLSDNFSEQSISVILYNMKIVFVSYEQNNFNISIIDIHGKNYETLTYGDHPQFSPDGSKIMYLSGRGFNNLEIFSMDTNGDNQTRLTNNNDGDSEYSPQFSPDGSKIVFVSVRDSDVNGNGKIYIMDSDGSNQTKLWDYESDHPQFSPDGSKIVYVGYNSGIYIMDVDGNNQTELYQPGDFPQFSPDGKMIVFNGLYIMNVDGTNLTRLQNNGQNPQFQPPPKSN